MKVLVVGSGGREHAIVTSISNSDKVSKIYCAPGNAGIAALAECVDIGVMDFDKLVAFAKDKAVESGVKGILIFIYLCETFCGCIIIVYVWRVSKQLETSECRTFACLFVYIVNLLHRIGLCVLTCYYLFTRNLR